MLSQVFIEFRSADFVDYTSQRSFPPHRKRIKMQLDVEESTPASDMTYWFHQKNAIGNCHHTITCNMYMNYFLLLCYELFSSLGFWSSDIRQTDRQTDRKRCIRAHRAKAQVCSKMRPSHRVVIPTWLALQLTNGVWAITVMNTCGISWTSLPGMKNCKEQKFCISYKVTNFQKSIKKNT